MKSLPIENCGLHKPHHRTVASYKPLLVKYASITGEPVDLAVAVYNDKDGALVRIN